VLRAVHQIELLFTRVIIVGVQVKLRDRLILCVAVLVLVQRENTVTEVLLAFRKDLFKLADTVAGLDYRRCSRWIFSLSLVSAKSRSLGS